MIDQVVITSIITITPSVQNTLTESEYCQIGLQSNIQFCALNKTDNLTYEKRNSQKSKIGQTPDSQHKLKGGTVDCIKNTKDLLQTKEYNEEGDFIFISRSIN